MIKYPDCVLTCRFWSRCNPMKMYKKCFLLGDIGRQIIFMLDGKESHILTKFCTIVIDKINYILIYLIRY